jgi:hypothetical protein
VTANLLAVDAPVVGLDAEVLYALDVESICVKPRSVLEALD